MADRLCSEERRPVGSIPERRSPTRGAELLQGKVYEDPRRCVSDRMPAARYRKLTRVIACAFAGPVPQRLCGRAVIG